MANGLVSKNQCVSVCHIISHPRTFHEEKDGTGRLYKLDDLYNVRFRMSDDVIHKMSMPKKTWDQRQHDETHQGISTRLSPACGWKTTQSCSNTYVIYIYTEIEQPFKPSCWMLFWGLDSVGFGKNSWPEPSASSLEGPRLHPGSQQKAAWRAAPGAKFSGECAKYWCFEQHDSARRSLKHGIISWMSCRHSLVSCPNFKEIKLGNKKKNFCNGPASRFLRCLRSAS